MLKSLMSGSSVGAGCSDALHPASARPTEERVTSDDRDLAASARTSKRRDRARPSGIALAEFLGIPHKNVSMGNSQKLDEWRALKAVVGAVTPKPPPTRSRQGPWGQAASFRSSPAARSISR